MGGGTEICISIEIERTNKGRSLKRTVTVDQ